MLDTEKEKSEVRFLREPSEERTALYELMRTRYTNGDKEKQLIFSLEIADERISDYTNMFTTTK